MSACRAWAFACAGLLACTERGSAPDSAPSSRAAAPGTALPSGTYHVVAKRVADTCSPTQTGSGARDVFVGGRIVGGMGPVVSVPLVVLENGVIVPRLDIKLAVGEAIHNTHSLHVGGSAKATYDAKLTEVRADGFTVDVARAWDGLERDDGGGLGPTPVASCRAEEELSFTLATQLCPARCTFDAHVASDGGVAGHCACP